MAALFALQQRSLASMALVAFTIGFGTPAAAQPAVADFVAGPLGGAYAFASSTPKTFGELLRPGAAPADPVNIVGHIVLPPASADKLAAVVLMHGSGVFSKALMLWLHGDADDTRCVFVRNAQTSLATCPIEVDIETLAAYDRATSQRLQGDAYQAAAKSCEGLGASVEGDRVARDKAAAAALAFLRQTFGL